MTQFRIRHDTVYRYTEPVTLCQNVAHLKPRPGPHQTGDPSAVTIDPAPAVLTDRPDYFGNPATYFTVQEPHTQLTVCVRHTITVRPVPPPAAADTPTREAVRDGLRGGRPDWLASYQFAFDSRYAAVGPFNYPQLGSIVRGRGRCRRAG